MSQQSLFHVPSILHVVDETKKITPAWRQLFINVANLLNQGYPPSKNAPTGVLMPQSVTIPIAKLTSGGANGSLTFTNGLLTSAVDPT
jgi:hypothetical protein